jgi:FdhE protein
MRAVPTRPPARSPSRPEPRDVVELKALRARSPELATAVDLQLATLDLFRRTQARVPLPPQLDTPRAQEALAAGRPLLRFADLPLNWTDYRWALRETADLLLRFELVDRPAHAALQALTREGNALEAQVEAWFAAAVERRPADMPDFAEVYERAMRPFVARCAEVWAPRLDLSDWHHGYCPVCGGGPELAVTGADEARRLVCGRCTSRWTSPRERCPWCGEDRPGTHTTLSTRDGHYVLDACDTCRRYVKCCDERAMRRPVMPWVDAVATMPLDAAAMQRGYEG